MDRGLLNGRDGLRARVIAGLPVMLVAAPGAWQVIAGAPPGRWVAAIVAALIVALIAVLRTPRRTDPGSEVLAYAMKRYAYLRPRNKPSTTTYGPAETGKSVALFGGASLFALDPGFGGVRG